MQKTSKDQTVNLKHGIVKECLNHKKDNQARKKKKSLIPYTFCPLRIVLGNF